MSYEIDMAIIGFFLSAARLSNFYATESLTIAIRKFYDLDEEKLRNNNGVNLKRHEIDDIEKFNGLMNAIEPRKHVFILELLISRLKSTDRLLGEKNSRYGIADKKNDVIINVLYKISRAYPEQSSWWWNSMFFFDVEQKNNAIKNKLALQILAKHKENRNSLQVEKI